MNQLSDFVRFGTRGQHAAPKPAKFRQDIQGLRALAVGVVVLDHANIPGFSGGFVGVDVFFVISGFLITGLLLGDVAKYSRVRFTNFYSRRAQRILPAATVTIAVATSQSATPSATPSATALTTVTPTGSTTPTSAAPP